MSSSALCTWGLYSRWKLSYAYRSNINLTVHDGNYLSILAELAVTRSLPKTMCHIKRSFDYGTDVVGEYFGKFNFPVGVVRTLIHCRYVVIYENVRLHYDVMPCQRFPHYCPPVDGETTGNRWIPLTNGQWWWTVMFPLLLSRLSKKGEWLKRLNTLSPRKWLPFFQTSFSNVFSWIKIFDFRFKFHWSLSPSFQLTIY